jgi:predicted transcriptional regulator YdeE
MYFDKEKNPGDIEKLWNDLGAQYKEIAIFAKKDDHGNAVGFWGAMSDETMNFLPWKELKEGYYMAGVEVGDRIKAPKGWEKWMIPAFAYLYARVDNNYQEVFDYVIHDYIPQKGFHLVGAVQEYNCPEENGQLYLFFPIKKL